MKFSTYNFKNYIKPNDLQYTIYIKYKMYTINEEKCMRQYESREF